MKAFSHVPLVSLESNKQTKNSEALQKTQRVSETLVEFNAPLVNFLKVRLTFSADNKCCSWQKGQTGKGEKYCLKLIFNIISLK